MMENTGGIARCGGCTEPGAPIAFSMAYQPIFDCRTGGVYAYEALVRGPAGEAASSVLDQLNDDNRYAFDQACRGKAIKTAVAAGLLDTDARLSINFLPNAIYSPLACIRETLKAADAVGMPTERLILEFTESESMRSPEHVRSIIDAYRRMGFGVAIDDFGAGYAGLNLLARFCPTIVKLDMDLIRAIDSDPRRAAIVRGIVAICIDLETVLIAEGVETAEEAERLRTLGVRYMQGYFFARPAFEALPPIRTIA